MRKAKRWVYWCDFCGKSGRSAGYMSSHEKSCTMNPDRVCRMCTHGEAAQAKMGDMLKALELAKIEEIEEKNIPLWMTVKIENEKEAIERLREVSNNCPMCMLAAIRQTTKYPMIFDSFKFEREKAVYWNDCNEASLEAFGY